MEHLHAEIVAIIINIQRTIIMHVDACLPGYVKLSLHCPSLLLLSAGLTLKEYTTPICSVIE